VVNAIREQNVQVAAGVLGQPPAPSGTQFQLTLSTMGRLVDPGAIREHRDQDRRDGQVTLLKDVARVELGALDSYDGQHARRQARRGHGDLPAARLQLAATSDAVRARWRS
jgi:multidrug efflux pump subunit AcrB